MKIIIKLTLGLILYSIGIVMTINANLGLAPWDVFHMGISIITGFTFGVSGILIGLLIIIFNIFFGEKVGIATILNMIIIGIFIDILMLNNIIPIFNNIILQLIMMFLGIFIIGIATYYYLSVELGSGPRDGLMVLITKKSNKSVRFVRNSIELTVLLIGFLLGGKVGIGTILMSLSIGPIIQFVFYLYKFDVKKLNHKYINFKF